MTQTITINGAKLAISHTILDPTPPTLIFLHDSLGCITLWRDFPEKLGAMARCNVLVYDRLGYGQSSPMASSHRNNDYLEQEADVLYQLMEQRGLRDNILFGHSDGGSIALLTAAKYPEYITAVITEGAHIFVEEITLKGIHEAVEAWHTTSLREKLQKYHGSNTTLMFDAWTKTWLGENFRDWNIESFLPRISCPVLAVQGEADEFGSQAQVDGIISGVKGPAQRLIIPGIGHTPHKEARDTILEHVAEFIAGLPTAPTPTPAITPEIIAMIAQSTGLEYTPESTDGSVCLATSDEVRPEYRLTFTKADLQRYLYASADNNGTVPPPQDADEFWRMVELG